MMNEEKKKELHNASGELLVPKRGRPRKAPGDKSLLVQDADGKIRKPRQKKTDTHWLEATAGTFIGQQVHGVLDGSFDAGYLLTVRLGESQTLLHGIVFDPGLSVPLSDTNDIAPNVKFTQRRDIIYPSPVQNLALAAGQEGSMVQRLMEVEPLSPPCATARVTPTTSESPFRGGQTCMTNTIYYGEVDFEGLEIQATTRNFSSN